MKLLYVAGPYRSRHRGMRGVHENIERAASIALELWVAGAAVICPHKNTAFFDGAAEDSVWLTGDLEMLRRCDAVVMVPGWEQSVGAVEERRVAEDAGIPVFDWGIVDEEHGVPAANRALFRFIHDNHRG